MLAFLGPIEPLLALVLRVDETATFRDECRLLHVGCMHRLDGISTDSSTTLVVCGAVFGRVREIMTTAIDMFGEDVILARFNETLTYETTIDGLRLAMLHARRYGTHSLAHRLWDSESHNHTCRQLAAWGARDLEAIWGRLGVALQLDPGPRRAPRELEPPDYGPQTFCT